MTSIRWMVFAVSGIVLAGLAACGGGSGGGGGDPEPAVVELEEGGSLSVPAGAVADDIEITSASVEAPTGDVGFTAVGPFYEMGPDGLVFSEPATLILPITGDLPDGTAADQLGIVTSQNGVDWIRLESGVDLDAKTVAAEIDHFTGFGVAMFPEAGTPCEGPADCTGICSDFVHYTELDCGDDGFCVEGATTDCSELGKTCDELGCVEFSCEEDDDCPAFCTGQQVTTQVCGDDGMCTHLGYSDCLEYGLVCHDGQCVEDCQSDDDCPGDCLDGVVLEGVCSDDGACASTPGEDCAESGQQCFAGACGAPACATDADCQPWCNDGVAMMGLCVEEVCQYGGGEDCAASGKGCSKGHCMEGCETDDDCPPLCLDGLFHTRQCLVDFCEIDATVDCPAQGKTCDAAGCTPLPCEADGDCPAHCLDDAAMQGVCQEDGTCGGDWFMDCVGTECVAGKCMDTCATDGDCPADHCAAEGDLLLSYACVSGVCKSYAMTDCAAVKKICMGDHCQAPTCFESYQCGDYCLENVAWIGICPDEEDAVCEWNAENDCTELDMICIGDGVCSPACEDDGDCEPVCLNGTDLAERVCGSEGGCVPGAISSCSDQDKVCNGGQCVEGCGNDADCPPICLGTVLVERKCENQWVCEMIATTDCWQWQQLCDEETGSCWDEPCWNDDNCQPWCNGSDIMVGTCAVPEGEEDEVCVWEVGQTCQAPFDACVGDSCTKACDTDADCPATCQHPGNKVVTWTCDGGWCTQGAIHACDLATEGICVDGQCVLIECDTAADCPVTCVTTTIATAPACPLGFCEYSMQDCGDQDECTDDACAAGVCQNTVAYMKSCDDGNLCTLTDECDVDGECKGIPKDCDDQNPCTDDSCDSGDCVYTPSIACQGACFLGPGVCVEAMQADCGAAFLLGEPCPQDPWSVNVGYEATLIDPAPGLSCVVTELNDAGTVVGYVQDTETYIDQTFAYTDAGGSTLLACPAGEQMEICRANALTGDGLIVGLSFDGAIYYQPDGLLWALPAYFSGPQGMPYDVNETGTSAGFISYLEPGSPEGSFDHMHAAYWPDVFADPVVLPHFPSLVEPGDPHGRAQAYGINLSGLMVGESDRDPIKGEVILAAIGVERPVSWTPAADMHPLVDNALVATLVPEVNAAEDPQEATDNVGGAAVDINDARRVVFHLTPKSLIIDGESYSFHRGYAITLSEGGEPDQGTRALLATLGGQHTAAMAINEHDQMVGYSTSGGSEDPTAAYWSAPQTVLDLSDPDLVSGLDGAWLVKAESVNDLGQIAAVGQHAGAPGLYRCYRLDPIIVP